VAVPEEGRLETTAEDGQWWCKSDIYVRVLLM